MDISWIPDKRTAISEQAFYYHVNFPPPAMVSNQRLPVVYGLPRMGSREPLPEFVMTRWRGSGRPEIELFNPGFYKLPGEGTFVAPVLSGSIRLGVPTGGYRSRAEFAETPLFNNRLSSGIVPGTVPVVAPLPVSSRAGAVYAQPER